MRKTYHCCVTSHDEVMFRDEEDFVRGFNCYASAVLETESRHLADGFMTSHTHFGLQTDRYSEVIGKYRYSYSRYFNAKYGRRGRLGLKDYLHLELDGLYHIQSCLSYIMRQGLHHGITSTPFGYQHCSVNVIFQKELGKCATTQLLPESRRYKYLPSHVVIPPAYRMDRSGLLLREDIVDVKYVEEIYLSPRNFLYQMNRVSDDRWEQEQREEKSSSPVITLELIEGAGSPDDVRKMRFNEQGRADKRRMTDLELCSLIDKHYLPGMFEGSRLAVSIYGLSLSSRNGLANRIWDDVKTMQTRRQDRYPSKTVTERQLIRCLALRYPY